MMKDAEARGGALLGLAAGIRQRRRRRANRNRRMRP